MPLPPAFRVTETADALRIEWDNRVLERDGCTVPFFKLFWLMWASASVWITGRWVWDVFHYQPERQVETVCCDPFFMLMTWFVTWITAQILLSRNWSESVEVTRHAITHTCVGRMAPAPSVHLYEQVDRVAFGWDRDKPETRPTDDFKAPAVYINFKDGKQSSIIGQWVRADHKFQLFQLIRQFLTIHQPGVRTDVWGEPDPWAKW